MSDQMFKLNNGAICLTVSAPGGVFNADQLSKLASICNDKIELGKATSDECLAIYVVEDQVASVSQELRKYGLVVGGYQIGLQKPISCLGAICPDSMQDALQTALEIDKHCSQLQLQSTVKIGINGCARSCVANHTMDLALIGDANGYRLSIGGKTSLLPEFATFVAEGIPANEVGARVFSLLDHFARHAEPGETLYELIDRTGSSEFIKLLSPYSQDAAGAEDPFGAEEEPAVEDISFDKDESDLDDEIVLADELDSDTSLGEIRVKSSSDAMDQEILIEEETELLSNKGPDLEDSEPIIDDELELIEEGEEAPATDDVAEQAFEEQFEEDLEVAEKINSDLDENESDRQATLSRIQDEVAVATEVARAEDQELELADDEMVEDLELEGFDEPLSETIQSQDLPKQKPFSSASVVSDKWQLNGVRMLDDSVLVVVFSSGAQVKVDCERLRSEETRSLNFSGQEIFITRKGDGVEVIADGMAFFFPEHVIHLKRAS